MTLESELVKTMLYIERYHGDSLGIIQDNLATAQKNILGYVADETNQVKIKKYIKNEMSSAFEGIDEDVIKDIEHIQGTTWDAMGATMAQGFVTNGLANAFINYKNVSDGVKKRLNNEARLVQGHTLKDHFKHLTTTNTRKLQGLIVDGQSKGLGVQEINRNIRNTLGNVNRNQVSTLVRTTLLEAAEEAKNESMDFFSDEILGWRYSAVMDSRTSKVCFVNNGIRHKKQSDFKVKPKNHYQCRSMFVPITELSEQLEGDAKIVQWDGKTVNHRDGTKSTKYKVGEIKSVPKNASAETYFKAFDTEYQVKYMGVKRYNLWKSGKMGFDEAFGVSRKSSLSIGDVKEAVKPKIVAPHNVNPFKNSTAKEARDRLSLFSENGIKGSNIGSVDLVNGIERGINDVMSKYNSNGKLFSIETTSKKQMASYSMILNGENQGRGIFKIGQLRRGFDNIEASKAYSQTLYDSRIESSRNLSKIALKRIKDGKKVPPIMQQGIDNLKNLELMKSNTKIWNTTDLARNEFEFGRIAFNHETWHKIDLENFLSEDFGKKIALKKIPSTEIVKISGYALSGGTKELFAEVGALYSSDRKNMIPKDILDIFEETIEKVKK